MSDPLQDAIELAAAESMTHDPGQPYDFDLQRKRIAEAAKDAYSMTAIHAWRQVIDLALWKMNAELVNAGRKPVAMSLTEKA